MDLRQIHYFVAIAEAEHFGRAAQRLHIAQPALSRQVKLLEAELGVDLFERLPRGVRLTEAGRVFLAECKGLQGHLARAIAATRAAAAGQQGALRLGFIEAVAWQGLVPDAIRAFRAAFPQVDLTLAAMPTGEQLAALRQGQLDAALIYNPLPADDLTATPLVRHKAVLAVPAEWPHQRVTLADLAAMPLVGFQRRASPRFFDDLHARFRAAGFTPRYVAELMAETEILALVSAGVGAAVANSCQMWRPPHGVRFVDVEGLNVSLGLALMHRADDAAPVLERFKGILAGLAQQFQA
ncbi:MAG: LysR family transcriptional regulator [Gemmobacter sp.]|uniref:LysR family transcriptional regulator n=1 Tax=Gemmobacter sp. TaxID=1898957 RepID=UPI00391AF84D